MYRYSEGRLIITSGQIVGPEKLHPGVAMSHILRVLRHLVSLTLVTIDGIVHPTRVSGIEMTSGTRISSECPCRARGQAAGADPWPLIWCLTMEVSPVQSKLSVRNITPYHLHLSH